MLESIEGERVGGTLALITRGSEGIETLAPSVNTNDTAAEAKVAGETPRTYGAGKVHPRGSRTCRLYSHQPLESKP